MEQIRVALASARSESSDEITLVQNQYTGEVLLSVQELLDLMDFWEREHESAVAEISRRVYGERK
jgi:hypothetical protein